MYFEQSDDSSKDMNHINQNNDSPSVFSHSIRMPQSPALPSRMYVILPSRHQPIRG